MGLIEAPERGWGEPLILSAPSPPAPRSISAFIAWERRTDHPMLDVRVFRNLRFSAASISITFVFFALMGVMYFLTTYLQSVLGFSALEAGFRMLPIAAGMIVASKLSVAMTRRFGTKLTVATGLAHVAGSMPMITGFDTGTGDMQIAMALGTMGQGIGLAMSPATDAIMERAAARQGRHRIGDERRRPRGRRHARHRRARHCSPAATAAAWRRPRRTSPPRCRGRERQRRRAHEVAAQIGGGAGDKLIAMADGAFVDATATTASIAAAAAVIGALIALAFLPSRDRAEEPQPIAGRLQPAAA